MGNRVKGRVKKKSIKAAMHSGMGSKRKLSRMGKNRKKDHAGLDATFIGRSACLKRLQVTLKDFRRLCILKGVYPREPRGRAPKNKKGQVYYHIKDIKAISHEPVLDKFREFKTFMKRVRKAAGRNEKDEAARLDAQAPTYSLHHLVRERYPRFVDALADLDDALALIYLFAALPSAHKIKTKVTKKAQTLAASWSAYCAITSSITKTFVSVKGIYFEANVNINDSSTTNDGKGTPVRWIVPHAFTQNLPKDVDYRVMLTFFEFYDVLLSFVMFKLYNDIGVQYPLRLPKDNNKHSTSLLASHLHTLSRQLRDGKEGTVSNTISAVVEQSVTDQGAVKNVARSEKTKNLLKTVDTALHKIANEDSSDEEESEGGNSEEDGDDHKMDLATPLKAALSNLNTKDATATDEAASVTTPLTEDARKRRCLFSKLTFFLSREVPRGYLELVCLSYGAQAVGWEGDDSPISVKDPSITHHLVDRPQLLSSTNTLPKSREYVQPQWILDCANHDFLLPCSTYKVGTELPPHLSPWVNDEEEGYRPAYAEVIRKLKNGETLEEEEREEDRMAEEEDDGKDVPVEEDKDDVTDSESEQEEKEEVVQAKRTKKRKVEEDEAHNLAKLMMSKNATRLYGRMQHGISQKQAKVEDLQRRRKDIESAKGKSSDGNTPLKQKVNRLKDERKAIEKDYKDTGGSMKKKKRSRK